MQLRNPKQVCYAYYSLSDTTSAGSSATGAGPVLSEGRTFKINPSLTLKGGSGDFSLRVIKMNKKRLAVWLIAAVWSLSAFFMVPLASPAYTESVIETSRTGSLTLRKLVQKNEAPLPGTGLDDQAVPSDARPLAGVTFSRKKIAAISQQVMAGELRVVYSDLDSGFLSLAARLGQPLSGRQSDAGGSTLYYDGSQIESALRAMGSSDQTGEASIADYVRGSGEAFSPTDAAGYTTAGSLPLGLYLIAETGWDGAGGSSGSVAAPSAPFLISLPMTNIAEIDGHAPGTLWQYDVTAFPKNSLISVTKNIVLDDGHTLGTSCDAQIGDTINEVITSDVPKLTEGRHNETYKISDRMDEGLSFAGVTAVTLGTGDWQDASRKALTEGTDYTVNSPDDQHFEVTLTAAGLAKLDAVEEVSTLCVSFSAVVNEKASIGPASNKNTPSLTYATDHTAEQTVTGNEPAVYTYELDLIKTASVSGADLTKVVFEIAKDGTLMTFKREAAGLYHSVIPSESGETSISPGRDGKLIIKGLDAGSYTLTETATAPGLNLLTAPVTFALEAADPLTGALASASASYGSREPIPVMDQDALARGVVPWTIDNASALLMARTGGRGPLKAATIGFGVMGAAALAGVLETLKRRAMRRG